MRTADNRTENNEDIDIYTKMGQPRNQLLPVRGNHASFYQKNLLKPGHVLPKNISRWSAGGAPAFLESQRRNNRFLIKHSAKV